jgi:hypothetical protein
MINCDRCHEDVDGYVNTPGSTMSAGYYVGWSKFMDAGENIICDSCMWSDPRYIKVYGEVKVSTQEER